MLFRSFSSNFFENKPNTPSDSPLASIGDASDPERHKKRNNATGTSDDPLAGKQTGARSDIPDPVFKAEAPAFKATGGGAYSPTLVFDESAGKASPGSSKSSSGSSAVSSEANFSSGSSAGPDRSSLEFDETAQGGTPSNQRQASLRKNKTPDELDAEFFRKRTSRQSAEGRTKGGSLRTPAQTKVEGIALRKPTGKTP